APSLAPLNQILSTTHFDQNSERQTGCSKFYPGSFFDFSSTPFAFYGTLPGGAPPSLMCRAKAIFRSGSQADLIPFLRMAPFAIGRKKAYCYESAASDTGAAD